MSFSELATSAQIQIPASRRPVRAIGIDLGTTNSAVAEVLILPESADVPEARCIDVEQPTRQGPEFSTLVPSFLALHGGQVYIGAGAKDLRARVGDLNLELYRNIFWDCKNHMGIRRTYHKASAGYRSAKEIGGHLLKFLIDSAAEDNSLPADATVVTVPASFQAAQRQDTLEAAQLAGIELTPGALLDEPVAAFIGYAFTHGLDTFAGISKARRLVVFDFGGGTCDVALFELRPPNASASTGVGVAPLSVSRYHRLGGGDIDRKIAVDVLIPQVLEQNELQAHELGYRVKADCLIPALLGCAESLKVGLCREIARLQAFGLYEEERSKLVQTNPGPHPCTLRDGTVLQLQAPTLSSVEFEKVLEPFLECDLLHPREDDFVMTCSVFAPLQDALERAHLEPEDIDFCLLVGGSTLIPQIAKAVEDFFFAAKFLSFDDSEQPQTAVAHGAAWQALSLAVHGRGLVSPITGSSVSIQTASGPVELIGNGSELPYPAGGDWAESDRLVVPKTSLSDDVKLRVELRGADDRVLVSRVWTLQPPVAKGDPLQLRYRMDVNQALHLRLARGDKEAPAEEFPFTVENPLTNVVNPNAKRDQVLELEERMRTGELTREERQETVARIAELETDLGRYERAFDLLANLNKTKPDAEILNRMGMIAGRLGDHEREEKCYREATRMQPSWIGPLFNLALSQEDQGKLVEAMWTIDAAIERGPNPPSLILKASLAAKLEHPKQERDALLEKAFAAFGPLATLSSFEFSWYRAGAGLSGDSARQRAVAEELERRLKAWGPTPDGLLPEVRSELARRPQ